MSRFGTVAQQYFDSSGKPLAGGKLYFYETGTTTAKTVYSDSDLSTSLAQPVTLDASGYQPDVFFAGSAKAVLTDSADVQVDVADPVGATPAETFPQWSASPVYGAGALVQGSDNILYTSISSSNQGNDPTTSSGEWMGSILISQYDAGYTYNSGYIAISSGVLWECQTDGTIAVTPSNGASEWDLLALPVSGGTMTGLLTVPEISATGAITSAVYTITDGASVTLSPDNGVNQEWTLTADRTPTLDLDDGQYLRIMVTGAFDITWDAGIFWSRGVAPAQAGSDWVGILLWKNGTKTYGADLGPFAVVA